jgi:hypothetical protein
VIPRARQKVEQRVGKCCGSARNEIDKCC